MGRARRRCASGIPKKTTCRSQPLWSRRSFWLPSEHDPDQLLALRWAYAAQVSLLDRCLEALLEWFDAQPAARETLLVLLGSRGYPLGRTWPRGNG